MSGITAPLYPKPAGSAQLARAPEPGPARTCPAAARDRRLVLPVLGGILGLAAMACSRPPPDASPDGVVRLFLEDMDSAGEDRHAIRRAYDLLGPASRANLQERARRASELQGRHVQPWDMIAAGLFGLAFRPKAMHATVVGDRANVEVLGEDPRAEHATVVCTHEGTAWRVEPGFPEP